MLPVQHFLATNNMYSAVTIPSTSAFGPSIFSVMPGIDNIPNISNNNFNVPTNSIIHPVPVHNIFPPHAVNLMQPASFHSNFMPQPTASMKYPFINNNNMNDYPTTISYTNAIPLVVASSSNLKKKKPGFGKLSTATHPRNTNKSISACASDTSAFSVSSSTETSEDIPSVPPGFAPLVNQTPIVPPGFELSSIDDEITVSPKFATPVTLEKSRKSTPVAPPGFPPLVGQQVLYQSTIIATDASTVFCPSPVVPPGFEDRTLFVGNTGAVFTDCQKGMKAETHCIMSEDVDHGEDKNNSYLSSPTSVFNVNAPLTDDSNFVSCELVGNSSLQFASQVFENSDSGDYNNQYQNYEPEMMEEEIIDLINGMTMTLEAMIEFNDKNTYIDCDHTTDVDIRYNGNAVYFYSSDIPLATIQMYVERLVRMSRRSKSVYVTALVYLERVQQLDTALRLSERNVRRLLITALYIADRYMEDVPWSGKSMAEIGGLPDGSDEICRLEIEMLKQLDWNCNVDIKDYRSYEERLREMATGKKMMFMSMKEKVSGISIFEDLELEKYAEEVDNQCMEGVGDDESECDLNFAGISIFEKLELDDIGESDVKCNIGFYNEELMTMEMKSIEVIDMDVKLDSEFSDKRRRKIKRDRMKMMY